MPRTWFIASRACTWLVLLCHLYACTKVTVQQPFDISAETQSRDDYQLGPDDVIEVLVWKNADLSKVVTVRPDGRISLPRSATFRRQGLRQPRCRKRSRNV